MQLGHYDKREVDIWALVQLRHYSPVNAALVRPQFSISAVFMEYNNFTWGGKHKCGSCQFLTKRVNLFSINPLYSLFVNYIHIGFYCNSVTELSAADCFINFTWVSLITEENDTFLWPVIGMLTATLHRRSSVYQILVSPSKWRHIIHISTYGGGHTKETGNRSATAISENCYQPELNTCYWMEQRKLRKR
jgi:hypothetical protein